MFYGRNCLSGRNAEYTVCQITCPVFLLNDLRTLKRFISGWYDHKYAASVAFVWKENILASTALLSHLPETTSAELQQA